MADTATTPTEPVKIERAKQNGFTRPIAGTKTGLVWDIADELSATKGSPALRDEVMTEYKARVADASDGTISTQYSRWCGFHGVQDVLRKQRAEMKAAADKEKEAEKAEKKKLREAEKAAKKQAAEAAAAKKKAAADAKAAKAAAKEG